MGLRIIGGLAGGGAGINRVDCADQVAAVPVRDGDVEHEQIRVVDHEIRIVVQGIRVDRVRAVIHGSVAPVGLCSEQHVVPAAVVYLAVIVVIIIVDGARLSVAFQLSAVLHRQIAVFQKHKTAAHVLAVLCDELHVGPVDGQRA